MKDRKCYFAPLEGITGYNYRIAHHRYFGGIDKYFTPFLSPNQNKKFGSKELNDILPEHNKGMYVVPQIMTNQAQDFIWAANELKSFGYGEINLNLGCPSKTVVTKRRGSGFLAEPEELERFFDQIFSVLDIEISAKIRIGKDSPKEFYQLIQIFNRFPLKELIIHPRIQQDYYRNKPNLEVFSDALSLSTNQVCYNGDIFTKEDQKAFTYQFPDVGCIMYGRGLLRNPGLANAIKGNEVLDKQILKEFHDAIYEGYKEIMSGERNVLFKMKELWTYMIVLFPDSEKYAKKIKKASDCNKYDEVVNELFRNRDLEETI